MTRSGRSFWYYFFGTSFFPGKAFQRLAAEEPHPLAKGLKAVLLVGLLLTLTVIGFGVAGAVPMIPTWMAVSSENFYFYEIFFALPTLLIAWAVSAAVAHLLGRSRKAAGEPTWAKNLGGFGFAIAGPLFLLWIPVTASAIFLVLGMSQLELVEILSEPGLWQTLGLGLPIAAVIWMFFLFAKVGSAVHRSGPVRTFLSSLAGMAVFVALVAAVLR